MNVSDTAVECLSILTGINVRYSAPYRALALCSVFQSLLQLNGRAGESLIGLNLAPGLSSVLPGNVWIVYIQHTYPRTSEARYQYLPALLQRTLHGYQVCYLRLHT